MLHIRSRAYYVRRRKKERPTNMKSLPKELLFEILLRVPADHLYERARLVCRRWYHIIHSHAFINAQMHGATYGLLLSPVKYNTLPLYVTADAYGGIHTSELNHISKLGVLATCNGLILEMKEKGYRLPRLVIVNPATKQSFLLPPLPTGVAYSLDQYGFAYSAASLAYKVIAPYTVRHSPLDLEIDYGLRVLTVGVDESWRQVEIHHLPDHVRPLFFKRGPVTSEGFLHWGRGKCCATLDVETEIITLSEAPGQYHESRYKYLSTGRCLSVLAACGYLSWEVWEMKAETGEWRKALPKVDLGAQKCWNQQFGPEDGRVLMPLGWVKYPHVLALYFDDYYWTEGRPCIFYNIYTHQLHSIELPKSYTERYAAFVHKNSLMWLS
ncbi:putative F-box protein At3g52320 [Salvia miltiorrhiza]|uniref:putative F-box protein At3g52320 n=1 Tax=Salvia miltiorrhiza TaxID=226208 RepID=UPI0025AB9555|nr:putative F-box protein At3g52320 [Salvia miltiorrhiza]